MTALLAVARYEFRMQARKRSLWIAATLLGGALIVLQGDRGPRSLPVGTPAREVMGTWALLFAILMPLAYGMLLADRLVRDRKLRVEPLLESLPHAPATRLAGKYLGGIGACALPGLAALLLAAITELPKRHDPALIGWALVAFVVVTLPGIAMVAGFALVCPVIVSVPLFRVLFVGYWFWGNMLAPDFLPSLTGTLLTPIGDYGATWLLANGHTALFAGTPGFLSFLRPDPSAATAALSVAVVVLCGLIPLAAAAVVAHRSTRQTWPSKA
ncbi:hypothetical protein SAMN05421812_101206 [Asanoa hainanensis]|uniref:ABC-2 type transport system permease protein n=1 Tax=Asanoa hainanensis TaxID=560556 RepID=A0A239G2N7_9ACTN|nr:hypothetical protein [Asanoa hainanensis]SNS63507.1 hypothetical protein SAMN05421812_101206 [Asanoa hainanensis]